MIELDDIDRRILGALQAEGRLAMVDLAERVGLSPTPCQRRVRRLEQEGVVAGYTESERLRGRGNGRFVPPPIILEGGW